MGVITEEDLLSFIPCLSVSFAIGLRVLAFLESEEHQLVATKDKINKIYGIPGNTQRSFSKIFIFIWEALKAPDQVH